MGTWVTRGFEAFQRGTFDNAGQNLYVSRAGILQRIHLLDLNQDGYLDLVFCNSQDHLEAPPAYVYSDVFGEAPCTPLPSDGSGTGAVGDLNGDGLDDLVLGMEKNGATSELNAFVYYGSEEGLTPKFHTRLPAPFCQSVAIGDFNGDGHLDLAMVCWNKLRIFYGCERGYNSKRFVDLDVAAKHISAADIDSDGFSDLYITRKDASPLILWGGVDGLCASRTSIYEVSPGSDIHAESIATTSAEEGAVEIEPLAKVLFLNNRWHLFFAEREQVLLIPIIARDQFGEPLIFKIRNAASVATGDIRGVGVTDLVFAAADETNGRECSWIYWGNAHGYSDNHRTPLWTTYACDVAVGDLDGDGCDDIVLCQHRDKENFSYHSLVFRGGKDGITHEPVQLPTEGARRVFIANPHPDGKPRVVFVNRYGRNAIGRIDPVIYWGSESGFHPDRAQYLSGQGAVTSVACDFNDDGQPDLVMVNSSENAIHLDPGSFVFFGKPDGFSKQFDIALPTRTAMAVVCADLNRDGYLDLIFSGFNHNEVLIFYGNSSGFDNPQKILVNDNGNVFHEGRRMCLADFNNDGWLDLVLTDVKQDRCFVLWGGPDGFSFERKQTLSVFRASTPQAADLTGNGYLDLIIGSHKPSATGPYDSFLYIYWNDGAGLREDRRTQIPIAAALGIAVADFNNDGYLDIFVSNYHDGHQRDIPSLIFWGGEDGNYTAERSTPLFTHSAAGCLAADFNEDGFIDLVVPNHKTWGDHVGESFVFWNGPNGFCDDHITRLPTKGPHGIMHIGPGNQRDRGSEEYYVSEPFEMPLGSQVKTVEWDAEFPIKTWVRAQVRTALSVEDLAHSQWHGSDGIGTWFEDNNAKQYAPRTANNEKTHDVEVVGNWLQFRLALGAVNSGNTPRVREVRVIYE